MTSRLAWFVAGAALTGAAWAAVSSLLGPSPVIETKRNTEEFYNAFAIHGPLQTDWTHVHQLGDLQVWSDAENKSLAITKDGQAVQMLTTDDICCTFEIFEQGDYRATVKYGNYDQRLLSQGVDPNGTVWTYVDMGINGTTDFRYIDGVSKSTQQVIMTQFAGEERIDTRLVDHDKDSGW